MSNGKSQTVGQSSTGRLGQSGLKVYKPGQGYYVRVGSAIGYGVLVVGGAFFWFDQIASWFNPGESFFLPLQYGVAVGWLVLMGAVLYWLIGLNRKANDFFIATEGEMKKVSWSSKKEVIRSTKVVIVTVVIMGLILFFADLFFMSFFNWIGVLKTSTGLGRLFGMES